jgi:ATP-dependent exoDNAse (exonuclease V) beta subunit
MRAPRSSVNARRKSLSDWRRLQRALDVDEAEVGMEIRGGALRGTLLHKLMEEALTGETGDEEDAVERGAGELMAQLGVAPVDDPTAGISPREVAETVCRTLALPQVAELRQRLQPETAVRRAFAPDEGRPEIVVSGTADAVVLRDDGGIDAVIDWKSDVSPGAAQRERYQGQIRDYLLATGAARGLVVYMTVGQVDEVHP